MKLHWEPLGPLLYARMNSHVRRRSKDSNYPSYIFYSFPKKIKEDVKLDGINLLYMGWAVWQQGRHIRDKPQIHDMAEQERTKATQTLWSAGIWELLHESIKHKLQRTPCM